MKYGSLINLLSDAGKQTIKPEVGMGITILSWTDRDAATIIEVSKSGSSFTATLDDWKRTDNNGMSECQEYEFTPNPANSVYKFRKCKNGRYYTEGGMKHGQGCVLDHRERYYDFSF